MDAKQCLQLYFPRLPHSAIFPDPEPISLLQLWFPSVPTMPNLVNTMLDDAAPNRLQLKFATLPKLPYVSQMSIVSGEAINLNAFNTDDPKQSLTARTQLLLASGVKFKPALPYVWQRNEIVHHKSHSVESCHMFLAREADVLVRTVNSNLCIAVWDKHPEDFETIVWQVMPVLDVMPLHALGAFKTLHESSIMQALRYSVQTTGVLGGGTLPLAATQTLPSRRRNAVNMQQPWMPGSAEGLGVQKTKFDIVVQKAGLQHMSNNSLAKVMKSASGYPTKTSVLEKYLRNQMKAADANFAAKAQAAANADKSVSFYNNFHNNFHNDIIISAPKQEVTSAASNAEATQLATAAAAKAKAAAAAQAEADATAAAAAAAKEAQAEAQAAAEADAALTAAEAKAKAKAAADKKQKEAEAAAAEADAALTAAEAKAKAKAAADKKQKEAEAAAAEADAALTVAEAKAKAKAAADKKQKEAEAAAALAKAKSALTAADAAAKAAAAKAAEARQKMEEEAAKKQANALSKMKPKHKFIVALEQATHTGEDKTATALRNYTNESRKEQKTILQKDGIQSMIAAMHNFPDSITVQCAGCDVLSAIANVNDDNKHYIIAACGIEAILDAMERNGNCQTLQVQASGCAALSVILPIIGQVPKPNYDLAKRGIKAIVAAMIAFNDTNELLQHGCSALLYWLPRVSSYQSLSDIAIEKAVDNTSSSDKAEVLAKIKDAKVMLDNATETLLLAPMTQSRIQEMGSGTKISRGSDVAVTFNAFNAKRGVRSPIATNVTITIERCSQKWLVGLKYGSRIVLETDTDTDTGVLYNVEVEEVKATEERAAKLQEADANAAKLKEKTADAAAAKKQKEDKTNAYRDLMKQYLDELKGAPVGKDLRQAFETCLNQTQKDFKRYFRKNVLPVLQQFCGGKRIPGLKEFRRIKQKKITAAAAKGVAKGAAKTAATAADKEAADKAADAEAAKEAADEAKGLAAAADAEAAVDAANDAAAAEEQRAAAGGAPAADEARRAQEQAAAKAKAPLPAAMLKAAKVAETKEAIVKLLAKQKKQAATVAAQAIAEEVRRAESDAQPFVSTWDQTIRGFKKEYPDAEEAAAKAQAEADATAAAAAADAEAAEAAAKAQAEADAEAAAAEAAAKAQAEAAAKKQAAADAEAAKEAAQKQLLTKYSATLKELHIAPDLRAMINNIVNTEPFKVSDECLSDIKRLTGKSKADADLPTIERFTARARTYARKREENVELLRQRLTEYSGILKDSNTTEKTDSLNAAITSCLAKTDTSEFIKAYKDELQGQLNTFFGKVTIKLDATTLPTPTDLTDAQTKADAEAAAAKDSAKKAKGIAKAAAASALVSPEDQGILKAGKAPQNATKKPQSRLEALQSQNATTAKRVAPEDQEKKAAINPNADVYAQKEYSEKLAPIYRLLSPSDKKHVAAFEIQEKKKQSLEAKLNAWKADGPPASSSRKEARDLYFKELNIVFDTDTFKPTNDAAKNQECAEAALKTMSDIDEAVKERLHQQHMQAVMETFESLLNILKEVKHLNGFNFGTTASIYTQYCWLQLNCKDMPSDPEIWKKKLQKAFVRTKKDLDISKQDTNELVARLSNAETKENRVEAAINELLDDSSFDSVDAKLREFGQVVMKAFQDLKRNQKKYMAWEHSIKTAGTSECVMFESLIAAKMQAEAVKKTPGTSPKKDLGASRFNKTDGGKATKARRARRKKTAADAAAEADAEAAAWEKKIEEEMAKNRKEYLEKWKKNVEALREPCNKTSQQYYKLLQTYTNPTSKVLNLEKTELMNHADEVIGWVNLYSLQDNPGIYHVDVPSLNKRLEECTTDMQNHVVKMETYSSDYRNMQTAKNESALVAKQLDKVTLWRTSKKLSKQKDDLLKTNAKILSSLIKQPPVPDPTAWKEKFEKNTEEMQLFVRELPNYQLDEAKANAENFDAMESADRPKMQQLLKTRDGHVEEYGTVRAGNDTQKKQNLATKFDTDRAKLVDFKGQVSIANHRKQQHLLVRTRITEQEEGAYTPITNAITAKFEQIRNDVFKPNSDRFATFAAALATQLDSEETTFQGQKITREVEAANTALKTLKTEATNEEDLLKKRCRVVAVDLVHDPEKTFNPRWSLAVTIVNSETREMGLEEVKADWLKQITTWRNNCRDSVQKLIQHGLDKEDLKKPYDHIIAILDGGDGIPEVQKGAIAAAANWVWNKLAGK